MSATSEPRPDAEAGEPSHGGDASEATRGGEAGEAMLVNVRLFAILRERAGAERIELRLPAGATVEDALSRLAEHERLSGPLGAMKVALAVNREYATSSTPLHESDELALIPPLSGGGGEQDTTAAPAARPGGGAPAARLHVRISEQPLQLAALSNAVSDPRAGAIVIFQGVTRAVAQLSYEAYAEMAAERIARIAQECAARSGALALAVEHRVGAVALAQPSVIVAASAPHRGEAFAAARGTIDRIKAEAPIWKQELDRDGERRWVDGTPAPAAPAGEPPAPAVAIVEPSAGPAAELRASAAATGGLTHLGQDGRSRMVDVGAKAVSERVAIARARVRMSPQTAAAVQRGDGPKGEVLGVARIAGIQAGKLTGQLIPLAHPLPLSFVDVRASVDVSEGTVELVADARTVARTGVEMEAMTAASVAALTVYDMVKGIERGVEIERVVLLHKRGGRSDYTRQED
ncbi:MAG: cyclic pyranopterin monophosphate synthase MoaC [Solirubrobacteraceae bacterium]